MPRSLRPWAVLATRALGQRPAGTVMDEFIREVDEDYRREQILQIWRSYSGVFIALAVLLVAGVAGWRYWQTQQLAAAEAALASVTCCSRALSCCVAAACWLVVWSNCL